MSASHVAEEEPRPASDGGECTPYDEDTAALPAVGLYSLLPHTSAASGGGGGGAPRRASVSTSSHAHPDDVHASHSPAAGGGGGSCGRRAPPLPDDATGVDVPRADAARDGAPTDADAPVPTAAAGDAEACADGEAGEAGGVRGRVTRACAAAAVRAYFRRWRGVAGKRAAPAYSWDEVLISFVGSLLGMGVLTAAHYNGRALSDAALVMVIGSFAATAVLVYAVPNAPLAQPRNVIGGHVLGAVVGVGVRQLLLELVCGGVDCRAFAAAFSVALTIALCAATGTLHPPGGATAFIAVTGDASIVALGWWFVLIPAAAGAAIQVALALLVNNLSPRRRYPVYWY